MDKPTLQTRPTGKLKILLATLLALAAAVLIVLSVILPAEFNRDPLGTGRLLGLSGLSKSAAPLPLGQEQATLHEDTVTFELLPFEFLEYKYQLNQGSALVYSWTTSDTVSFDFHGDPPPGSDNSEASYRVGKGNQGKGAFVAPFTGIHGWFWANHGANPVTIKLKTAGFYTQTLEFRDGQVIKETLND